MITISVFREDGLLPCNYVLPSNTVVDIVSFFFTNYRLVARINLDGSSAFQVSKGNFVPKLLVLAIYRLVGSGCCSQQEAETSVVVTIVVGYMKYSWRRFYGEEDAARFTEESD